jgi:hypothetical protein
MRLWIEGSLLATQIPEWENGNQDLNGNGRTDDGFLELHDLDTATCASRIATTAGSSTSERIWRSSPSRSTTYTRCASTTGSPTRCPLRSERDSDRGAA